MYTKKLIKKGIKLIVFIWSYLIDVYNIIYLVIENILSISMMIRRFKIYKKKSIISLITLFLISNQIKFSKIT